MTEKEARALGPMLTYLWEFWTDGNPIARDLMDLIRGPIDDPHVLVAQIVRANLEIRALALRAVGNAPPATLEALSLEHQALWIIAYTLMDGPTAKSEDALIDCCVAHVAALTWRAEQAREHQYATVE